MEEINIYEYYIVRRHRLKDGYVHTAIRLLNSIQSMNLSSISKKEHLKDGSHVLSVFISSAFIDHFVI